MQTRNVFTRDFRKAEAAAAEQARAHKENVRIFETMYLSLDQMS
jgi:hypothetical protein